MPKCINKQIIVTTDTGKEIFVCKGSKSPNDFIVKFRLVDSRMQGRALTHSHLVSELHIASIYDEKLVIELRDFLLKVFAQLKPMNNYPPKLQVVTQENIERFKKFDKIRDFDIEFLLKSFEMIMLQEKTNYPNGTLTVDFLNNFLKEDRIMNMFRATFRR